MLDFASSLLVDLPMVFSAAQAAHRLTPHYRAPLKVLSSLVNRGILYRLKRGEYAFVDGFDLFVGANLLHGPSYVSYETALSHYGLIPERTETVLSVVDGRPVTIKSPIGVFEYHSQARRLFALGMDLEMDSNFSYAIATREKALFDTVAQADLKAANEPDSKILDFVINGLRIDLTEIGKLSIRQMARLAPLYRNTAPQKLINAMASLRRSKR